MRTDAQRLADWQANKLAIEARSTKVEANRVALDALAIQARTFARGNGTATLVELTAVCRKLAEMQARMWFNERYGDE